MANTYEDEDRLPSDNEELVKAEHEEAHDKEASNKELAKAYLEDKQEEKDDEKKKNKVSREGGVQVDSQKYRNK
jgi:hypothetical protein